MRQKFKFLLCAALLLSSCSKSSSSNLSPSIPDGDYKVDGPFCLSTGELPDFPSANSSAILYKFEKTEYKLNITGAVATQTFQSDSCIMTIVRELSINVESYFSMREKKFTTADPETCTLKVMNDDTTFEFSKEDPTLKNSDENKVELLFDVQSNEDESYTITSRNEEPDLSVWKDFGCSESDQIFYRLEKIQN